jgi:hypothetical protein
MLDARGATLAIAMMLAACSPLRSTPSARYQNMLLNVHGLGDEALRIETRRDPRIREYVDRNGQPDFIVIGSPLDVELVYAPPSRMVHFHGDLPDAPGEMREVTPIPTGLLQILPRDLQAGTPRPLKIRACWSVPMTTWSCRTCCATRTSCVTQCSGRGEDGPPEPEEGGSPPE